MEKAEDKKSAETQIKKKVNKSSKGVFFVLGTAYLLLSGLVVFVYQLAQRVSFIENNAEQMENRLAARVDENRKIYVYNMEQTLLAAGIPASSQQFETDIAALQKEVADAQEKIKTLKEAQVKEEFSDMYLRSLRMKRDELINKYSESMQVVLDAINNALEEVARENNVHTIFLSSAIAISTEYVIDVTPQIIERMKQQNVIR